MAPILVRSGYVYSVVDSDKAIKCYKKGIVQDVQVANLIGIWVIILWVLGDIKKALKYYKKAYIFNIINTMMFV